MFKLQAKKIMIFSLFILLALLMMANNARAADPVIYPVASSVFVTGAYITWSTDIGSNSKIDYGPTANYGLSVTDSSSATYHALTITGLAAGATYHFRVTSGASQSADRTFTTYANPTGNIRTVGSGKTYATIQACANAAIANDTCLVYSGIYAETVSPPISQIAFLAQEPARVSSFNISGRTSTQVKGFEINSSATNGVTAAGSLNSIIENNYIHASGGRGIFITDNNPANGIVIRKNIIYHSGWASGGSGASEGIYAYGDRMLIENNDISHGADFNLLSGSNVVVRNNIWHHASHAEIGGSEHIDGFQVTGSTLNFSLIEGNVEWVCSDATGNCHFGIMRNQTAPAADNVIIRHNFAYKLDGSGMSYGGAGDNVPNGRFYNNTFATEALPAENGDCVSFQNANNGKVVNNICYKTAANGWAPQVGAAFANGNIAFNPGYTGAWNSPYSGEATYASLRNQDPLFTNYPTSFAISAASPAKDAGVALTTVASGDSGSGTNLAVADARFFQPGWAGTQADWIAVGSASNAVGISSINYTTNVITLNNNISRIVGQSVWLYKKSDGAPVLFGPATDVGAYEYSSGGSDTIPPSPPKNVVVR